MKKKLWIIGFSLVTMILVGCGQVSQETGGIVEEPSSDIQIKETVVASTKLTISMTGKETSGYQTSAIETSLIASQSVEIEANVPGFMTFDVNSTISFDVNQLAWIEANGHIQINVTYNELMEDTLQNCRVRAYMVGADGLVGQINANNIIPLEVEVTAPPMHTPYSPLTTATKNIKQWDKPFNEAINEIILLKLKGDFRRALNQQFKGTIMLEFVRDDEEVVPPPPTGNTVLLLHMDGDGNSFVDSSASNHLVSAAGDSIQTSVDSVFSKSAYLGANDPMIEIPDSDDWNFSTGNFTIDFWVNLTSPSAHNHFYVQGPWDPIIYFRYELSGDLLKFRIRGSDGSSVMSYSTYEPTGIVTGQWHHIAVVRDNSKVTNVFSIYVDGQEIPGLDIESNDNSNLVMPDIDSSIQIAAFQQWKYSGYIDEYRISKGIARWTSNFIPSTAPY